MKFFEHLDLVINFKHLAECADCQASLTDALETPAIKSLIYMTGSRETVENILIKIKEHGTADCKPSNIQS